MMEELQIRDTGYEGFHNGRWHEIWEYTDSDNEIVEVWIARFVKTKATGDAPDVDRSRPS